jgi:bacterioferritin-associated ferredoxin
MALVCLCYGVNERRIRREIDHGASTIAEIAERCQAGSCCLSCHPVLDDLLAEGAREVDVVGAGRRRFVVA